MDISLTANLSLLVKHGKQRHEIPLQPDKFVHLALFGNDGGLQVYVDGTLPTPPEPLAWDDGGLWVRQ